VTGVLQAVHWNMAVTHMISKEKGLKTDSSSRYAIGKFGM